MQSRQERLEYVDTRWGRCLPTLNALPETEQHAFAQAQDFNSVRDLLAHIAAWWRTALEAVAAARSGYTFARDWDDDDAFNALAVVAASSRTPEAVAKDFEQMRAAIGGLIAELLPEAFDHPDVAHWLYETVIVHYTSMCRRATPRCQRSSTPTPLLPNRQPDSDVGALVQRCFNVNRTPVQIDHGLSNG